MSRREPVTDAEVLAAAQQLQAKGEQPTCRTVLAIVGGSMSTVSASLRCLQLNGRIGVPVGLRSLLLASYARRTEQVDALLDALGQAHDALAAAGLPVPSIPACVGPAVLGSATWPMPGADSATPDGFVVVQDEDERGLPAQALVIPAWDDHPAASSARFTQVVSTSDCNPHEHSTCDAQAEEDASATGAARGAPQRGPTARHTDEQRGQP